jgi:hypothetical protein
MDPIAIAISLGIPCLALAIMFAYIAVMLELDRSNYGIDRALVDERTADQLARMFVEKRIQQCVAQIVHTSMRISQEQAAIVANRRAIVEHRVMIAALNDLGKLQYRQPKPRKRVPTLSYHKAVTLPYHKV